MHPNKHALLFLFLWISFGLFGQDFEVNGRVSFHNSKLENKVIQYVKDVTVSTSVTPPVHSDYKGRFSLTFKESNLNEDITLKIEKTGYEVVNYQALNHFKINRKSLLRIFIAKKGYLEKEQKKLLLSNQNALYAHRDQLLDILAFDNAESKIEVQRLAHQLNLKIYNNLEAEEKVNEEVKNIEKKLEGFSKYLATVNLDFSSNMYQKAFGFYQKGNLEKTVEILDELILEKNLNNVIAVIERAKEVPENFDKVMAIRIIQLDQIKESLILKTIVLQQLFRYEDTKPLLKNLSKILTITDLEEDKVVFDLIKLPNSPMEKMNEEPESPIEIIEKDTIQITDNIVPKKENLIEEKIDTTVKIAIQESVISKTSTSGTLSKNEYETALLLKEKKLPIPDEIVSKGEIIEENKIEIVEEKPIVTPTKTPVVEEKNTAIVEPQPKIIAPKKEIKIIEKPIAITYDTFLVTKKTSLRTLPKASSKVLKRLSVGTKVEVIEQVNKYWSKVILNGKEGYVKVLLLKKED